MKTLNNTQVLEVSGGITDGGAFLLGLCIAAIILTPAIGYSSYSKPVYYGGGYDYIIVDDYYYEDVYYYDDYYYEYDIVYI